MTIRQHAALLLAGLLVLLPAAGAAELTLRWEFGQGALRMWGIEATPASTDKAEPLAAESRAEYRGWLSRGTPASAPLSWQLPGITLRRGDRVLRIDPLLLQLDPQRGGLSLADAEGRPWLIADMPHQMPGPQLDWRYLGLRLLPSAARALGEPALEQAALGRLGLRGGGNPLAKGSLNCRPDALWTSPGTPGDIALTAMSFVAGFDSRDCSGGPCISPSPAGSSAGEVVIAPDALLVNVGERDVPWFPKFFLQQNLPPDMPYATDQHPYLVWALYREDADGSLVPLGSSGVKHAFFAQNTGCPCNGDVVLYRGCGDLYSAPTNNDASVLGPRSEIDPRSGLWGRCGSVFDPDCDGVQNSSGFAQPFERRLLAAESELLAANHPGARWFIESWYVVRDDGNLDNSMAHREVLPAKSGSGWFFPVAGGLVAGPVIGRLADPASPTDRRRAQRLDLPEGRMQMAVRVQQAGSCRFLYDYTLMNLDYAHSEFSGTPPNLRMESSVGVRGLGWAVAAEDIQQLAFRDDDRDPGSDWVANASGALQLSAPEGGDLGWGRMATVRFESMHPPGEGAISVTLGDGGSTDFDLLVPSPGGRSFCDGFESP